VFGAAVTTLVAGTAVAPFTVGKRCRAARVIVERRMLKAQGAHALYIEGLSIRTETVTKRRGQRPWAQGTEATTPDPDFDNEPDE